MKHRSNLGILSLKADSSYNFVFFNKSCTLEMRYLVILKKMLRIIRHKVSRSLRKKTTLLFLSIKKNYYYSKKSKNSRMGKGKGNLTRPAIRVKKLKPFIYFCGHYPSSIKKLAYNFSKKTNLNLKTHLVIDDRPYFGLGRGGHPYQNIIFRSIT
mgnify:CR=1 FL=1